MIPWREIFNYIKWINCDDRMNMPTLPHQTMDKINYLYYFIDQYKKLNIFIYQLLNMWQLTYSSMAMQIFQHDWKKQMHDVHFGPLFPLLYLPIIWIVASPEKWSDYPLLILEIVILHEYTSYIFNICMLYAIMTFVLVL